MSTHACVTPHPTTPRTDPGTPTPTVSSQQRSTGRRALVISVVSMVVAVVTVVLAPSALAHTGLESSDPPADTEVTDPLDAVTLTFNAPISLLDDTVTAVASNGDRVVATETLSDDGLVVTATFDTPLRAGTWSIDWRVLASDSHPREGAYTLVVAAPPDPPEPDAAPSSAADAAPAPTTSTADDAVPAPDGGSSTGDGAAPPIEREPLVALEDLASLARVLFYVGLLIAAGLALFKAGPHAGTGHRARRLAGIALVSASVALVAGVAEVVLHVAAVSGLGVRGIVSGGTWWAVLGTGLGPALAFRTVGLALLAFGARRRVALGLESGPDWRKLLGAGLAFVSFQFVGHTASAAPPIVVRSADLVHAVAAAVWIGGIVGLLVTLRGAPAPDRARTVARFSTWATAAVAGVTLAGVALAWVNLPTIAAAWQTGYGQLLLAKLTLVGVLLALGAHNHFNVVPDVTDGDPAAAVELRRVVVWEMVLVLAVVVLTALLVNTTPL